MAHTIKIELWRHGSRAKHYERDFNSQHSAESAYRVVEKETHNAPDRFRYFIRRMSDAYAVDDRANDCMVAMFYGDHSEANATKFCEQLNA